MTTNFDKIRNMTLDEMATKLAVSFLAGCFAILRRLEMPEEELEDFGKKNLADIIITYKKSLQQEVSE